MKYLTITEAIKLLRISRPTAYKLIYKGILPGIRVGKEWRILEEEIPTFARLGMARIPGKHIEIETPPHGGK